MVFDFCYFYVRGLNNEKSFIKDFMSTNKLSFVALLETHVKKEAIAATSSFVLLGFLIMIFIIMGAFGWGLIH